MKKNNKETESRYLWLKHIAYHWARNTGKYDRSMIESIKDELTTDEFIYYHTFLLEEWKRILSERKSVVNVKKHKKNRFPIEDA